VKLNKKIIISAIILVIVAFIAGTFFSGKLPLVRKSYFLDNKDKLNYLLITKNQECMETTAAFKSIWNQELVLTIHHEVKNEGKGIESPKSIENKDDALEIFEIIHKDYGPNIEEDLNHGLTKIQLILIPNKPIYYFFDTRENCNKYIKEFNITPVYW
jgi:hypothetical protein